MEVKFLCRLLSSYRHFSVLSTVTCKQIRKLSFMPAAFVFSRAPWMAVNGMTWRCLIPNWRKATWKRGKETCSEHRHLEVRPWKSVRLFCTSEFCNTIRVFFHTTHDLSGCSLKSFCPLRGPCCCCPTTICKQVGNCWSESLQTPYRQNFIQNW